MNTLTEPKGHTTAKAGAHLLDTIRDFRITVGDGLNDYEFTRLLEQMELPIKAGFSFLSYCDRFVTLKVPRQRLENWYPDRGWILPAKEQVARLIAETYGLTLCEPPDAVFPADDSGSPHHHLELNDRRETIVIAHPQFLKVRLFGAPTHNLYSRTVKLPIRLGADLLQDLSNLYLG